MILNLFKILVLQVAVITLLHAVIPHNHHSNESVAHLHNEEPNNLLDYLEHAFHFTASYGGSDTYIVDAPQQDYSCEQPSLLRWIKNEQIFVVYSLSYASGNYIPQTTENKLLLRGPPSLI